MLIKERENELRLTDARGKGVEAGHWVVVGIQPFGIGLNAAMDEGKVEKMYKMKYIADSFSPESQFSRSLCSHLT